MQVQHLIEILKMCPPTQYVVVETHAAGIYDVIDLSLNEEMIGIHFAKGNYMPSNNETKPQTVTVIHV